MADERDRVACSTPKSWSVFSSEFWYCRMRLMQDTSNNVRFCVWSKYTRKCKNTWKTIQKLCKTPRARWNYTAPCIPPWSPPYPSRRCIAETDRGGSWRWWDNWWSAFSSHPWSWPVCPARFSALSSRPFHIALPDYLASESGTIEILVYLTKDHGKLCKHTNSITVFHVLLI